MFQHPNPRSLKISELSSSVDRLISVATSIKNAPPPASPEQPDDPAVQEMADKIERAIAVLEGRDTTEQATPPNFPGSADPISNEALATDINSPAARDPNAPI